MSQKQSMLFYQKALSSKCNTMNKSLKHTLRSYNAERTLDYVLIPNFIKGGNGGSERFPLVSDL